MTFTDVHMGRQKVPKSDIQSQFSMSKNVRIFQKMTKTKNLLVNWYSSMKKKGQIDSNDF